MSPAHFFGTYAPEPLPLQQGADPLAHLRLFAAIGERMDCIVVRGEDACKFLQGQVTCDMNEVAQGFVRLGAHCNIKGRAQASFIASKREDGISLWLPEGMAEPTLAILKKYAAFFKVTLTLNPSDEVPVLIGGHSVPAWFGHQESLPGMLTEVVPGVQLGALVQPDRLLFGVVCPQSLVSIATLLPEDMHISDQCGFDQALTVHRIAMVMPGTQETFIPQELNYDLNGGISFKKGCYKGQEIIARLHFKGTPKFRLALLEGAAPEVGVAAMEGKATLVTASGNKPGEVVQSCPGAPGRMLVLAALRQDNEDALFLQTDAERVALGTLPA